MKLISKRVDNKLNFDKHHDLLVNSCQKDLNLIKIINGIQRGGHPKTNISLYRALIRSKFQYSQVPSFFSSKNNIMKLQTVANKALRLALGLTRNTSNATTLALAGEPPWEFGLESVIKKYIINKIYYDKFIRTIKFEKFNLL